MFAKILNNVKTLISGLKNIKKTKQSDDEIHKNETDSKDEINTKTEDTNTNTSNLNENKKDTSKADIKANNKKVRTWYEERYETVSVQRNLLFGLLVLMVILSIVSLVIIGYLMSVKKFDPFVIEIDDTTGMARVVNPASSKILSANDELAKYFMRRYITSRETYNPVDFPDASRIVRLLSTYSIYVTYRNFISDESNDPTVKYGQKNTTYIKFKSWSKLDDGKYMIRFSVHETLGRQSVFHKIVVLSFEYRAMELTDTQRDINPVGFQVTGYRIDNDKS